MELSKPNNIIIDTDTGVDDAVAIIMAVASNVKITAITTVVGNTNLKQVTNNVGQLLSALNLNIPVYKGAVSPLFGPPMDLGGLMGTDGLGNASSSLPAPARPPQPEHAAIALTNLVRQSPADTTLVALGPLTNIALALRLDPEFAQNVPRLMIMGGAVDAKGNATPAAEFNICCDPEAADVVLRAGFEEVVILPWEASTRYMVLWDDIETMSSMGTPNSDLFAKLNHHTSQSLKDAFKLPGIPFPDPLAMAVALDPSICTRAVTVPVMVETSGKIGRGLMAVDWYNSTRQPANAEIVLEVDFEAYKQYLFDSLK
jgi:purine nucleosidase